MMEKQSVPREPNHAERIADLEKQVNDLFDQLQRTQRRTSTLESTVGIEQVKPVPAQVQTISVPLGNPPSVVGNPPDYQ